MEKVFWPRDFHRRVGRRDCLVVPKYQVVDGINAHQNGDKQPDPLDGTHTADRNTSIDQPAQTTPREQVIFLAEGVDADEAKERGHSEEEKHRVQENETRQHQRHHLKYHQKRHKPHSVLAEAQVHRSVVSQRSTENSKEAIEFPHCNHFGWLQKGFSALEAERAVVAGKVARKAHQQLPERRVDVKVELMLQVVGTELAEMGFVPNNTVVEANSVEPNKRRHCGENQRVDVVHKPVGPVFGEFGFVERKRQGLLYNAAQLIIRRRSGWFPARCRGRERRRPRCERCWQSHEWKDRCQRVENRSDCRKKSVRRVGRKWDERGGKEWDERGGKKWDERVGEKK